MSDFLPIFAIILFAFIFSFAAMNIGIILKGRVMSGGCGNKRTIQLGNGFSKEDGCGFCPEKKLNLCSSSDEGELKNISRLQSLGRLSMPDRNRHHHTF